MLLNFDESQASQVSRKSSQNQGEVLTLKYTQVPRKTNISLFLYAEDSCGKVKIKNINIKILIFIYMSYISVLFVCWLICAYLLSPMFVSLNISLAQGDS